MCHSVQLKLGSSGNIIESHTIINDHFAVKRENDGTDNRQIKYKKMAEIPVKRQKFP